MEEKQWFLYVVDKHEGPYSLSEIERLIDKGDAVPSSFVWREGLADWMMLSEISEFSQGKPGTDSTGKPAFLVSEVKKGKVKPAMSSSSSGAKALGMGNGPSTRRYRWYKSTKFFVFMLLAILVGAYHALTIGALDPALRSTGISGKNLGLPPLSNLTSVVASATNSLAPVLSPLKKLIGDKIAPYVPPQLKRLLVSVELPPGIPVNQAEILRDIAKEDISKGVKAGLAFMPGDDANPSILVVSNAPDAADFSIIVTGKEGTLLNSFGYQQVQHVKVMSHVGQSAKFSLEGSKPLPKGEYMVSVQSGGKQLANLAAFFGGPRDAAYEERILEFNQRISDRVRQSVAELTQIADTLSSMANESAVMFSKTMKVKAPGLRKRQWDAYRTNYAKIATQISELIGKAYSDPLPIGNLPAAYDDSKRVFEITDQLHLAETGVIEGKQEMAVIRPLAADAMRAIAELKEKVKSVR